MKVKKDMLTATGLLILMAGLTGMLTGCARLRQADFAEEHRQTMAIHRQFALSDDLAILRPDAPVTLPDPLTLDHAVRIGLENNLNMRISRILAEISDDNALADRLKLLPQLSFSGNLSKSSAISADDEDTSKRTASLSLVWNILDFGLSYLRARQTALKGEVRRMERLRQAQVLASDISIAYWQAVLAEDSLEEITKIQTEIRGYKRKAEALVAEKRLDPIASKSIEKKILELAVTAANLQAEISGAKIGLCKLMGINPMTPVRLKREPFRSYLKKMPKPASLDLKHLEMISLNNRPEFFSADLDLAVQQDQAKSALLSMLPGIKLSFSGSYNSNSSYKNNLWLTWGAGITSSILSLPAQYANWQAQLRTTDMVRVQRLLLTAGVIVEAHLALHNYAVKSEQFDLYDDSFGIAADLLEMSRERYELGLLSSWALSQRMLEEVVARLSRDRRIIDLFNAYNKLLVTLGLDYTRWHENLADMNPEALPRDIETKDIYEKPLPEAAQDDPEPLEDTGDSYDDEIDWNQVGDLMWEQPAFAHT